MSSYLDFIFGCFRAPGFLTAFFLAYLKFTSFILERQGAELIAALQHPIALFAEFVDKFYAFTFELLIEISVLVMAFPLGVFGFDLEFQFPDWYSTAAFFSTILYGAQRASMKIASPVIGDKEDRDESVDPYHLSQWPRALLATIWNALLLIYIPVNSLAKRIREAIKLDNISGRKVSQLFKVTVLGFFMMGFLFLFHDLLWMLVNRDNTSEEVIAHRKFHLALLVAVMLSLLFAYFTIIIFAKRMV